MCIRDRFTTKIKDALDAKKIDFLLATPYIEHVKRMREQGIECITSATLVGGYDMLMLRQRLRNTVLVVDEIGLSNAHHFSAIQWLCPAGLILIGDFRQLTPWSGDIQMAVRRLGCDTIILDLHDFDRFGGDKKTTSLLRRLAVVIDEHYRAGLHSKSGPGYWPPKLSYDMREAGLQFVCDPKAIQWLETSPEVETIGWRNSVVVPLKGKTVHKAQGGTVVKIVYIPDYKCDPRLLFTALSRATNADRVYVRWY